MKFNKAPHLRPNDTTLCALVERSLRPSGELTFRLEIQAQIALIAIA